MLTAVNNSQGQFKVCYHRLQVYNKERRKTHKKNPTSHRQVMLYSFPHQSKELNQPSNCLLLQTLKKHKKNPTSHKASPLRDYNCL